MSFTVTGRLDPMFIDSSIYYFLSPTYNIRRLCSKFSFPSAEELKNTNKK